MMYKAFMVVQDVDIIIVFKHVSTHVGIYDNEKTDRLTNTVMERTHIVVTRN